MDIKKITFLLFSFFLNLSVFSQYQVKSPYLIEPVKAIGYVDSCAQFWMKTYDEIRGGFYTNINRTGSVTGSTDKQLLTQTRNAYGLTKAFMLTGNESYLLKAKQALNFMYTHGWDTRNEGWISNLDVNGNPIGSSTKTAFNQHYALLGILAYYEATLDTIDYNWLMKGYQSNEKNLWDSRPDYFGYFDNASGDWLSKNKKSFNSTVDAFTTHLINLNLITNEKQYRDKLILLANITIDRIVTTMDGYQIGFVEAFNSDWTWNDDNSNYNTRTIMGHVLKTAWVLAQIYNLIPEKIYLDSARKLIDQVRNKGYDHIYGGPFKDYNRVTGLPIGYGVTNSEFAKAWWQMEQAITSGLVLYFITGNNDYLRMADETLSFFMKYFVDHTFGEVYSDRFQNGDPIVQWGTNKGNGSKAGYHSIELGYYTYIYGKLFYRNEDFTLYYNFTSSDKEREIVLTPLPVIDNRLVIKSVNFKGSNYTNFIASERKLILPAGSSGKFAVTFELNTPSNIDNNSAANIPANYRLGQNYPNPFNSNTIITFYLPQDAYTTIKVYDLLGKEVAVIFNGIGRRGLNSVQFNANHQASQIYFYQIISGQYSETKKMILSK